MTDEQYRLIKTIKSASLKGMLIECVIIAVSAIITFLIFNGSKIALSAGLVVAAYFVISGITYSKKSTDVIKNNAAVECVVEDYLIIQKGNRYALSPILRNIVTNELYYTFDKYDLSLLIKAYAKKPDALSEMEITRIDHTEVKIGDRALIYIKQYVDPKLHIEPNDGYYFINNENILFRNTNPEHDISILNNVKFFEGVIDVE